MRVSIIIPAYNAGKTIERALLSLYNQTFKDIQIVVVDDGSTDETIEIVHKFLEIHNINLKLYSQKNAGVSCARNKGICISDGDAIMFLDADDVYKADCVERLVRYLQQYKADMVLASYTRNTTILNNVKNDALEVVSRDEAMVKWMYNNPPKVFCSAIYLKSLISKFNIKFPEEIKYGEDLEFTWNYIVNCRTIVVCNDKLYGYIDNPNSAVHRVDWTKTSLINSTIRIGEMLRIKCPEFSKIFDSYMVPRTIWAVARTYAKSSRYDLILQLEDKYTTKIYMKKLIKGIFTAKKYRGETLKKIIIIFSAMGYLIHPRMFYFIIKCL